MIKFENISKKIGKAVILDKLNLEIEKGEFICIIGPSGCGKTTTLKLINKLILPSNGEIYIDGKPISKEDTIQLRRGIGYVIQSTGLFPHMTIKENIEMIPKLKGENKEDYEARTIELLELVGLPADENLNKYPSELSGGQKQRVGIARAFATNSEIILMDEPFSALDPITRNYLQEELFTLQKELNKTVIFVTHDMDEAIKLADKICIMNKGKIAQFDTPEKILRNPANDFVKEFIGTDRVWGNPEFIKASDIMIKDPISIKSSRTVLQGIKIMRSNKVDSLLITDKENRLTGLVTLKEIKKAQTEINTKLQDIMETEIIYAYEHDNLLKILGMVSENSIGYVPILNRDKQLVGLITRSSLISILSEQYLEGEGTIIG